MKNLLFKYSFGCIVLLLLLLTINVRAQEAETEPIKKDKTGRRPFGDGDPFFTFGISPQYLAISGFQAEAGYFVNKLNNWVNGGVIVFNGPINTGWGANTNNSSVKSSHYVENIPFDQMKGYSFSLANKYIMGDGGPGELETVESFISMQLDYRAYRVKYYESGWVASSGQPTYYNYDKIAHSGRISSMALSALFGGRFTTGLIYMDISLGIGYRLSGTDTELKVYRDYSKTFIDYGYTGPYPAGYFTIGLVLSK